MTMNKRKIDVLVGTAMLAALVIILQFFVVIPVGAFTITLTLIPIMIGAILYGPSAGAFLGGVFGTIVSIQVVTGAMGAMSLTMFEQQPFTTIAVCVLKGVLAGLGAGWIYKALRKKHPFIGVISSAIACPIINTGVFVSALFLFYQDLMMTSAAEGNYANLFSFVFVGVITTNFLVEFAVNVCLVPIVLRLIKALKLIKRS